MIRKWVLKPLAVVLLVALLLGLLYGLFVLIIGGSFLLANVPLVDAVLPLLGILGLVVSDILVGVHILRWLIYGRSMSPVIYYVLTVAAIIALLLRMKYH
jgi:hypothetical protein